MMMTDPNLRKLLADLPLRGRIVALHTLTAEDYRELAKSCLDPEIWRSTIAKIETAQQLREYLDRGIEQLSNGVAVPLVIRLATDGTAVGSTRLAVGHEPGMLEIGWTFIAPAYHRCGVNAEAKLLLLNYSFDSLGCNKVVFKVAAGNERSKAALTKLGATPFSPGPAPDRAGGMPIGWFALDATAWPTHRHDLEKRLQRT